MGKGEISSRGGGDFFYGSTTNDDLACGRDVRNRGRQLVIRYSRVWDRLFLGWIIGIVFALIGDAGK